MLVMEAAMDNRKKTIKAIIYSEYFKAALLPILIIELALLAMYFGITDYIEKHTQETLLSEARLNIGEISSREVKNINQQIASISSLGAILQNENARLFSNPDAFGLPAGSIAFSKADNAVTYKSVDNGGSSVFYSNITGFGPEELRKATITEAFDPLFKATLENNPNIVGVYFNSFDSMCRYYPFLQDVFTVFPADMNIPEYNFYYLADEAHNPDKGVVWTDAYLDPAGQGWMASCIAPIYDSTGFLQGVTGFDITIEKIIHNILDLKLPWNAGAFLVDRHGVILAMPEQIETVFNLKELRAQVYESTVKQDTLKPEEFNLLKNKDVALADQFKEILESNHAVNDILINGKSYFLTQAIIDKTDWRLMILVDKNVVYAPVYELDVLTKRTGIMAFSVMIIFYALFFSYLMYKSRTTAARIAGPISHLATKTTEMGNDITSFNFEDTEENIEEIDLLMKNFRKMGEKLSEFYAEMDYMVKQRTQELTQTVMNLEQSHEELRVEIAERRLAEEMLEKSRKELEIAYQDLQSANLQIAHQEKMASIGQLAAGVAHEINNPMGFVISNISMMQEYMDKMASYLNAQEEAFRTYAAQKRPEDEDGLCSQMSAKMRLLKQELGIDFIKEDVGNLISETLDGTDRVKRIVQELRAFSRNSTETEIADIHVGIDGVLKIIGNELKYKVKLIKDYGDIPQIMCNQGQLNQVFLNVLMNARHAIQEQGTITIQTRKEGDAVTVRIKDTGHGIPENIQSRIFDPFFTTKPVGSGTGLGLSISYRILENHNGSIAIEESSPKGTTFIIKIPIVEA